MAGSSCSADERGRAAGPGEVHASPAGALRQKGRGARDGPPAWGPQATVDPYLPERRLGAYWAAE
eukprot:3969060-Lingulodinium_polyedra.AAC.1